MTAAARKRTTSFSVSSSERPAKSQKTTAMPLRRSESMLYLPTYSPDSRPPQHQRQQRGRKQPSDQLTIRTLSIITKSTIQRKPPPQIILPSPSSPIITLLTPRSSSPLSPTPVPRPGRPVFPRSKPEPDLYRTAIKMRMRTTPEGLSILSLGPRLAMEVLHTTREIWAVTRDLERMVEEDLGQEDVPSFSISSPNTAPCPPSPAPPILTTSWVVVKGGAGRGPEDWEMVDCAA